MKAKTIATLIVYACLVAGSWWLGSIVWSPEPVEQSFLPKLAPAQVPDQRHEESIRIQVNQIWDRIESKVKEVAPASSKTLREPATVQQIEELEAKLDFQLPVDLKASLLRHNGTSGPIGVFQFLSCEQILQTRENEIRNEFSYFSFELNHASGNWDPGALTIGESHFNLIVDLETKEVLIIDSKNYSGPHSDNFLETLTLIAKYLESGAFELHEKGNQKTFWLNGFGCPHY